MQKKWKENRKKINKLSGKVAEIRGGKMKFEEIGKNKVLIKELGRTSRKDMQKLSMQLTGKNTIIFLFGLNERIDIFASAGKDVEIDIGKIVKEISEILGGRGGGSAKLAQGFGTEKAELEKAREKIREMLK